MSESFLTKGIVGIVFSDRPALRRRLDFYFDTIQHLSSAGGPRFAPRPFGFETCQQSSTFLCGKKKKRPSVHQCHALHEQHPQKVSQSMTCSNISFCFSNSRVIMPITSLDETRDERSFPDILPTLVQHLFGSCCATAPNERAVFRLHLVTSMSTS